MAAFEKDDIPMLSNTDPPMLDEQVGSYFPSFASLTRSSSLSIPTTSSGLYGNEANLVGHTGPLRSDRKSSFMVSGSTYTGRKPERLSQSNPGVPESKTAEPLADKFPSFKAKDESDWSIHNYAGRNEHLIKSGQLGMCSDPFCITCPTYNLKASKHKSLRMSGIFDHKVFSLLLDQWVTFTNQAHTIVLVNLRNYMIELLVCDLFMNISSRLTHTCIFLGSLHFIEARNMNIIYNIWRLDV